jgi:undecaprenyl-diphosphatase
MDSIIQADQSFFLYLNGFHSPFWDPIMVFISGKLSWLPFYLVLLWFLFKERKKHIWVSLIMIVLLIVATDQVSNIFKYSVLRLRPCQDPVLSNLVHTVSGCGGKYGFISAHAANTFGIAMFFTLFFWHRWTGIGLMLWALIVSYSRIYLGVHYPGDVLGGMIVGLIIGTLIYSLEKFIFLKFFKKEP